jgi:hypothetical protein
MVLDYVLDHISYETSYTELQQEGLDMLLYWWKSACTVHYSSLFSLSLAYFNQVAVLLYKTVR